MNTSRSTMIPMAAGMLIPDVNGNSMMAIAMTANSCIVFIGF